LNNYLLILINNNKVKINNSFTLKKCLQDIWSTNMSPKKSKTKNPEDGDILDFSFKRRTIWFNR